jgi:hypothetical protein
MEFETFSPRAVIVGVQVTLLAVVAAAGGAEGLAALLAAVGTGVVFVDLFIYVR